jgi:hypothetical protein
MKRCIKCKKLLPTDNFSKRADNLYKRRNVCKKCVKIQTTIWRHKNPKKISRLCARYYKELKDLKNKVLALNPCIVCKEKRIGCLDFHHLDPSIKESNVTRCHSSKKLMKELTKCVVLCANCHRLYHMGEVQLPSIINLIFIPKGIKD